jgi:hypothetical protein
MAYSKSRFVQAHAAHLPCSPSPSSLAVGARAPNPLVRAAIAIPQTFFLDAGRRVIRRVFGAVTLAKLAPTSGAR